MWAQDTSALETLKMWSCHSKECKIWKGETRSGPYQPIWTEPCTVCFRSSSDFVWFPTLCSICKKGPIFSFLFFSSTFNSFPQCSSWSPVEAPHFIHSSKNLSRSPENSHISPSVHSAPLRLPLMAVLLLWLGKDLLHFVTLQRDNGVFYMFWKKHANTLGTGEFTGRHVVGKLWLSKNNMKKKWLRAWGRKALLMHDFFCHSHMIRCTCSPVWRHCCAAFSPRSSVNLTALRYNDSASQVYLGTPALQVFVSWETEARFALIVRLN